MSIIQDPTEEELRRYTKDINGATLLDGKIIRIPATRDYMFKNLFGVNGKEENLRNFLEAILKIKIESIEIQNPELKRNSKNDKKGILDVRAKLSNGTICFIEMQVKDEQNIGERATFYICKLYTSTIESGGKYVDIEKTVAIIITDFSYFNRKEFHQIAHLKFEECTDPNEIVDEDFEETESEIITDKLELHIIDLKKFKKIKEPKGELADWLKLIIGDEEGIFMASKKNKAIKKANEENKILSLDKDLQEDYWYELKALLARNTEIYIRKKEEEARKKEEEAREEARKKEEEAREEARKKEEEAREEARKKELNEAISVANDEGMKEGRKKEKIEIAKRMIALGDEMERIIAITGLTKEEIKKIQENK